MASAGSGIGTNTEGQVLVATADSQLIQSFEIACSGFCPTRTIVETLDGVLASLVNATPDVVLVDYFVLPEPRAGAISQIRRAAPESALILIMPKEGREEAYRLLEHGVNDVVHRPPHASEMKLRVGRVLETRDMDAHLATLEDAISERSKQSFNSRAIVSRSPAMRKLAETIDRVARMRTTILVAGESGVGKELVSRDLHFRSSRKDGPFIPINCAALPPHLIETELFGHERGAFTGAVSRRAGKFELAHRGTLFLDELGETDLPTQAMLLRVLETQEFMRVGGTQSVHVDVRLVAATNADLERLVREGKFREDLFYRLKVVTLDVPPLRERREDIPELAETTLLQVCRMNHLRPRRLTAEALAALCAYPWPGNVRELMNTLEAVVVATPSETLDVSDLPVAVQRQQLPSARFHRPLQLAGETLKDIEAEAIRRTLIATQGSRTQSAKLLGIGVRTLRRRIQELGLDQQLPPKPGRPRKK